MVLTCQAPVMLRVPESDIDCGSAPDRAVLLMTSTAGRKSPMYSGTSVPVLMRHPWRGAMKRPTSDVAQPRGLRRNMAMQHDHRAAP